MRTSSASTATRANTPDALALARLALFWFGIQSLWGALLGISIQARVGEVDRGHAIFLYGIVATSGAFVAAATQLIAGPLSDRRRAAGSRRLEFYATGALLGCVALFAFYVASTPISLIAAYASLQVALNIAIGPYQAVIPDVVSREMTGRASAWMAALQSSGNAAGAILVTLVGNGLAVAAILSALLLATCAVTLRTLRRWPRVNAPPQAPLRLSRPFALLFASRVALFAGFYTLLGYMFFYTTAFIARDPSHARRIDGILILAFTVAGACGAALAARPSDRSDRRNVATLGALGAVASLAIFLLFRSPAALAPAIALGGAGWGCFLVADWAIACRLMPSGAAAASMAVWNLAVLAPQVVAPLVTTLVLSRLGGGLQTGVTAAFTLAGLEMLVGIWLLRRLPASLTRE